MPLPLPPQGINRTILSWLRLWDEAVFGRPTPLRTTGGSSGGGGGAGGRGGKGGVATGEGAKGKGATPKGRRFEKRVEFQNPETFSGVEVSGPWEALDLREMGRMTNCDCYVLGFG